MKRVFILLFFLLISAGCSAESDSKILGDTISVRGTARFAQNQIRLFCRCLLRR